MRWHWQDLNDNKREVLHGRGWLYVGGEKYDGPRSRTVGVEWRIGRWDGWRTMFTRAAEETDYAFGITLGFASLWINLSGFRRYGAMARTGFGRDTGFYYANDHLVLKWDCDDSSWSKADGPEHGWSKSWFVRDVLFGRAKYTSIVVSGPHAASVPMPEAAYPCTVTLSLDTWKRPRWPWPTHRYGAEVGMHTPVPVPGKGENSWDCGEDAIYSQTSSAITVDEAIENVRASAMRSREKYGGRNWTPEKFRA